MPLYEYKCDACGHCFEKIQKFSDPLVDTCPKCGGVVRKLVSSPAIQFKGSGFYITDYAKKDHTAAAKADSEGSGTSDQSEKSEKSAKSEKSEKSEKTEKKDKTEKTDAAKTEKSGSTANASSSSASTSAPPATKTPSTKDSKS
jgi:putative FmdB family regulatory protein